MGGFAAHRLARALEGDGLLLNVRQLPHLTRVAGALVVALFLAAIFTPAPSVLGYWTSVAPRVEPAEAIVVLGAGASTPPGILDGPSLRKTIYGIRLYQRGLAPRLVLSGGSDDGARPGEASLRVELARDMGVPPEAILAEIHRRPAGRPSTHEETAHLEKMLSSRNIRTILLITDSQHMRRARKLFREAGFSVLPAPIDEASLDASAPEERLKLMRWIGQEWLARLYYAVAYQ